MRSVEKYQTFFLRKSGVFQWGTLAWGNLELSYACVNFFLPVNSISWWQAAFEWGGVWCSRQIFIVRKMNDLSSRSYLFTQDMLDSTNSDPDFMNTIITGDKSLVYGFEPETVIFHRIKIRRAHWTLPHSNL